MGRKTKYQEPIVTYKGYLHIPNALTYYPPFLSLKSMSLKLLIDLGSQYNGRNNGDLSATLKILKPKGWTSNDTITRAKRELVEKGLIIQTKHGGRGMGPDLFALAWQPIHACGGKHSLKPTTEAPLKLRDFSIATKK